MTNLIVAKQLSKQFQKYKAIENLNFTVEEGEILGFLGPVSYTHLSLTVHVTSCSSEAGAR